MTTKFTDLAALCSKFIGAADLVSHPLELGRKIVGTHSVT